MPKKAKEGVEWAANSILRGDGRGDLILRSPVTKAPVCVMLSICEIYSGPLL